MGAPALCMPPLAGSVTDYMEYVEWVKAHNLQTYNGFHMSYFFCIIISVLYSMTYILGFFIALVF